MSAKKELTPNTPVERIYNGIAKENPVLVQMIGMCPLLAVTTSVSNGIGMGLTTMVVLVLSNILISLLRKVIPNSLRMPCYIGVIASFVTVTELALKAYLPSLYEALGLYIPLIVVNCIIMGRAEAFAGKYPVVPAFFDGIGMGLGFTVGLVILGAVRELLGAGTLLGFQIMPSSFQPINMFIMAPGAFFVLAIVIAIIQKRNAVKEEKAAAAAKKEREQILAATTGMAMSAGK
ncbi:MAG: electron transport complex subunit E [Eubacterium sp.]|nr:electron transport complex subunit E [Eubacterium sp.]